MGSSSLSREDTTRVGSLSSRLALLTLLLLEEVPLGSLAEDGPAAVGSAVAAEPSPCVGSRRVRGRLSFLSGSWAGCSVGEAVTDRAFLLRVRGLEASASRARSNAPQARLSSRVSSTGGGGGCRRSLICGGMLLAKESCTPRRCAMLIRCCHRCSSRRSSCWNLRKRSRSSSSSS